MTFSGYQLQHGIILAVFHHWQHEVVLFGHFIGWRQKLAEVNHAGLHALAVVYPFTIYQLVIVKVKRH